MDGVPIEEETAWGTILADAARHIAKARHSDNVEDEQIALTQICNKINLELMNPTSEVHGKFV